MKNMISNNALSRVARVALACTIAVASSGCFSMLQVGKLATSSSVAVKLTGHLSGQARKDFSSGKLCYHLEFAIGAPIDGCSDYRITDPAGLDSFIVIKDVTSTVKTAMMSDKQYVWILAGGKRADGNLLATGIENQTFNSVSSDQITIEEMFDTDKAVPATDANRMLAGVVAPGSGVSSTISDPMAAALKEAAAADAAKAAPSGSTQAAAH